MQFFIALIVGVGVGTWVYGRVAHSTGNNTQTSLTVAGIAAAGAFFVIFMLARAFLKS